MLPSPFRQELVDEMILRQSFLTSATAMNQFPLFFGWLRAQTIITIYFVSATFPLLPVLFVEFIPRQPLPASVAIDILDLWYVPLQFVPGTSVTCEVLSFSEHPFCKDLFVRDRPAECRDWFPYFDAFVIVCAFPARELLRREPVLTCTLVL